MPYIPCEKCGSLIPPTITIDGKRRSLNKRKYCLSCSPFGSRNTQKLNGLSRKKPYPHKYGPKDEEVIQQARALHINGYSNRMIAQTLGLSKATIFYWVQKGFIPHRGHAEAMRLAVEKGRTKGSANWSEESKAKQRSHMLRRIAEDPNNHPNRKLAGNRKKMSFPEKLAFDILTEAGIPFEHNKRIDKYYPDFTIGMKILEIDGERWHDPEKDAIRDARLTELGYQVVRVSAKEVLKNPQIILDRLQVLQQHLPFGAEGTQCDSEVAENLRSIVEWVS